MRRNARRLPELRAAILLAWVLAGMGGCSRLRPYESPGGQQPWQDPRPPRNSLAERAAGFQKQIACYHRTKSGVLRYRRAVFKSQASPLSPYGDLADGSFHTGIYLASQALRYQVTRFPEALDELRHALSGLEVLMAVTGKPGLLSRHVSPAATVAKLPAEKWRCSTALPEYVWRGDVSKDQYAGFVHGLGVALAFAPDQDVRDRVGALAGAAADHLRENALRIIETDGRQTTYGDLRGSMFGIPKGVDALICLAIAKVAAVSTGEERHREFYESLVSRGYPNLAYWTYLPGVTKRVNDHMGFLALYPLLLLEENPEIVETLRVGARRSWGYMADERNAFFAFIHAGVVGEENRGAPGDFAGDAGAVARGRSAIAEFPSDKVEWPVDLTRPGFGLERLFFNDGSGHPRSRESVPLYLRVRSSSIWAGDPYRMVGRIGRHGEVENSGADYLVAYWLGRHHGFIASDE